MKKVIVTGLPRDAGPGDIVGAFTNEARIDGDQIGKIEFWGQKAVVEIAESVYEHVLKVMNKNSIAGVEVMVTREEGLEELQEYVTGFKGLVQLEREEEMERHEQEIKNLTGLEREKRGRALLRMKARYQGESLGGRHLVKFMKLKAGLKLPDHQLKVGDLLIISSGNPLSSKNPTGTVAEMTEYSISLIFDSKPSKEFLKQKPLRLDLYINDITYQRMFEALDQLREIEGERAELRDVMLGMREPSFQERSEPDYYDTRLNPSQKRAVHRALEAEDFFLVHGPPGTGKTVTLLEVIRQGVKEGLSVLATACSNTATDNLVEGLVERGVRVVRVGHPVRVTPLLRQHTLDYLVQEKDEYQEASQLREKAYRLLDQQEEYTHPSGRWRRGMSGEEIQKLARENRGTRGVPAHKIREMAEWLSLQEEIDEYFQRIEALEERAIRDLLQEAEVICTTNSTSGSELLSGYSFQMLVLDEATQATEPSALIPLIKADKVVMAGDHCQLPPTVLNYRAAKEGLEISLFERLMKLIGASSSSMLTEQYRMHDKIMNFSNQHFYQGRLKSAPEVARHTLQDLDISLARGKSPGSLAVKEESPVIFFDTAGMKAPEFSRGDSSSLENPIEADLVVEIVNSFLQGGLKPSEIAVISPYKDQATLIRKGLSDKGLEVDTVDGFQGREKELVVISLVRSNERQLIGFLKDLRRLNVALTRARKKLIVVGDAETISAHPLYSSLVEYIQQEGYYYHL